MTDIPDFLYMRARYYIPSLGRFINEDPIGLAGGLNLYGYVGNNPINLIDPIGLVHTDYNAAQDAFKHYKGYRFNREGQLVKHCGKVIGKATGKAARVLKEAINKFPKFFTSLGDIFIFIIIPPELKADPGSIFFDINSDLLIA